MPRGQVTWPGQVHDRMEGLHDVQINILRLCGKKVGRLDHISAREGCSMSASSYVFKHSRAAEGVKQLY
jgi:hypothetical protein